MNSIHGLTWLPNFSEKFVTWSGQEVNLYELRPKSENKTRNFLNFNADLVASENRYQYIRCVQASNHKDREIVAIGLGDGKVELRDFQNPDFNLEYAPRQPRMCSCMAWNEIEPNMLAIGHERHRSDTCITTWNVQIGLPTETENFLGHAESVQSMCWDKQQLTLIAGISQKQIRLFDLRQNTPASQPVQTKCVYGLSVAPNGNYLAGYFDSVVMLWDLRALERPLKQIQSSKNQLQLAWCPTKKSLLSVLQRESPYISLYDIRSTESDIYHIKKQLLPIHTKNIISNKPAGLISHSWHAFDFERALLLSEAGSILDFKIPLRPIAPSNNRIKMLLVLQRSLDTSTPSPTTTPPPSSPTKTSTGSAPLSKSSSTEFTGPVKLDYLERELLEQDPIDEMRRRALHDYGLDANFKSTGDFRLNIYLGNVWSCLNNLYANERLTGLKELLGIGQSQTSEALMASSRIESHVLQWPEFFNNSSHLICYRSDQRDRALKLCGWPNEQDFERFIQSLKEAKQFSRAAMIQVFHLKILAACDVLSQAADASSDPSMFGIAAIALSSFNADRGNSTWRTQRNIANKQIQDPHLRAIFAFLTTENENFDAVLCEEGISLADRLAFACKYLSESKLADYVKYQLQRSTDKGDLNGLLLTGESMDGINILQAYLDATADVQTVALLAINFFKNLNNNRIEYWISHYLDCLNSWNLWEKRAELVIKMGKARSSRSTRTVYLSCNFCGKSISNALQEDIRMRSASSNINKLSSCPSCRKPLPRCSLCLLHMGTTLNTTSTSETGHESLGWQSKPFSKWYSWCQTCRHGGHTEHILQWFKQNSECPVSSCTCRCADLDADLDAISDSV